ncbi:MAG: DUF2550 domain-containing protein [Bifidobacteriaceae bacterium]|jgi:hypothetical protein|nr:DUF2550 domain-containing protein [Bifidobacteriaceae bacterium]
MPQALLAVLAVAAVTAVGLAGLFCLRWRYLGTRPGSFPCVVIEGDGAERRERFGLATFAPGSLDWFARNSLSFSPVHRWPRRGLAIEPGPPDEEAPAEGQVVRLVSDGSVYPLVISRGASSGLRSWIEAGPTRSDSAT